MDRRTFLGTLAGGLVAAPLAVEAQAPRIGYLSASSEEAGSALSQTFAESLRGFGWAAGKNITIEYRWADNKFERMADLLADLIGARVDLIVASGPAARAARQATAAVPIVMIASADPVKFGLIESLAHPGGNATGLAWPLVEWGKWLELARDLVPAGSRLAIIANPMNTTYADYVSQNHAAAEKLGIKLQVLPVASVAEFPAAFASLKQAKAAALVTGPDALYATYGAMLSELALMHRVPYIASFRTAAEAGALLSYGVDLSYMWRRAAMYADRILRGTRLADLPVEQPSKYELIANLKTAKALGLSIPPSLLQRADQLIE
jgi:putative ABC transport system substrate-binding protein